MRRSYFVAAILVAYLFLGVYYTLTIPPWEATDEIAHFQYAQFLWVNHRLPRQSTDPAQHETTMAHHPPLYYALLGAIIAPFDTGDLDRVAAHNMDFAWGDPNRGGYNVVMHNHEAEGFPFKGSILALHLGRLLSVLAGLGVVVATYRLGILLFGSSSPIPIGGTLMAAFLPSFLFTSSTVQNDSLVAGLGALALWRVFALVHKPSGTNIAAVATLLSLAALTKTSGLILAGIVPVAFGIVWFRERDTVKVAQLVALFVVIFLALVGWWLVRNQTLYGDPVGWNVFSHSTIFPVHPRPVTIQTVSSELINEWSPQSLFWHTLILAFGYMDHYGPPWIYDVTYLFGVVCVGGLLIAAIRWRHLWRKWVGDALLGVVAVALMSASIVNYSLSFAGGDHGRYIFPVLPLLGIAVVLGLRAFIPHRFLWQLLPLPGICLLVLASVTPLAIIAPSYALANKLTDAEASRLVENRDATFSSIISLIRAEITPDRTEPGNHVAINIYWRAMADIPRSYHVFVELLDANYKSIGRADRSPVEGKAATGLWHSGDVISDAFTIPIPVNVSSGLYRVFTGFYELPSLTRLSASGRDTVPGDAALLGTVKVLEKPSGTPKETMADFSGQIALVQASISPIPAEAASQLTAKLTWLAERHPDADYTVSLQLLSTTGALVAQYDAPPCGGSLPTTSWEEGDLVSDTMSITIPESAPSELKVYVILYNPMTGKRLSVGATDAFSLRTVQVTKKR